LGVGVGGWPPHPKTQIPNPQSPIPMKVKYILKNSKLINIK
jgi:hypothetical protein